MGEAPLEGTVLALVILIGVLIRPQSAIGSLLASGPMRWLGERSYSIYLWNDLARIITLKALGYTLLGDIVWIVMFVVVAETSFRLVERPLRAKFARRSGVPRTPSARQPVRMRLQQLTHHLHLPAKPGADTSPAAVADTPDQLGQVRP